MTRTAVAVITGLLLAAPAATWADSEPLARRLLNSQGCKACHRIDGEGGSFAPDLSKVGERLDRGRLRERLSNPRRQHAEGRIADFGHLREDELEALVTFLAGRR